MPTKNYEEILLQELRDPDLAAEYLSATLSKRSLSGVKASLKKVLDGHGGADSIRELAGLSEREMEQLLGADSEMSLRPFVALLKALGLSLVVVPEEPAVQEESR